MKKINKKNVLAFLKDNETVAPVHVNIIGNVNSLNICIMPHITLSEYVHMINEAEQLCTGDNDNDTIYSISRFAWWSAVINTYTNIDTSNLTIEQINDLIEVYHLPKVLSDNIIDPLDEYHNIFMNIINAKLHTPKSVLNDIVEALIKLIDNFESNSGIDFKKLDYKTILDSIKSLTSLDEIKMAKAMIKAKKEQNKSGVTNADSK